MENKICSFYGCTNKSRVRGKQICNKHYFAQREFTVADKEKYFNRFWGNVGVTANPEKCWLWLGNTGSSGYGHCVWLGKPLGVHVVAFLLSGKILEKGQLVRHVVCRNRRCCNPRHLEAGSYKDNHDDSIKDGTYTRGSMHGLSKLTDADIPKIIRLRQDGMSYQKIGDIYSISHKTVERIVKGFTWKHIPREQAVSQQGEKNNVAFK